MTEPKYYVEISRPTTLSNGMRLYGGLRTAIWEIKGNNARRIDPPYEKISVVEGEDICEKLSLRADIKELDLPPGSYFPRIARPTRYSDVLISPCCHDWINVIASSKGQFTALKRSLENICRAVHPQGSNLSVYGHDIRNLLVLACTEVEAHWKGILRANGSDGRSTIDYVKLCEPLKLRHYGVKFPEYPWLDEMRPFEKWGGMSKPTQLLPWYAAYNATKHDREAAFSCATLDHALNAVASCFIMLIAQFGEGDDAWGKSGYAEALVITNRPTWDDNQRYYIPGNANTKIEMPKTYCF